MFIAPGKGTTRGFTLLEITLAVAILAMMAVAIYSFVTSNITVMRISSEQNATDAGYDGLHDLLSAEWQSLPSGEGRMTGEPFKFNGQSSDQIHWLCGAGPGLLTRYALDDFQVTMRIRPSPNDRNTLELGFLRKPEASGAGPETWIPLLKNVNGLQIRYFDPRLNSWVDRWTDTMTLPRLVKIDIGRNDSSVPWESIIALSRTPL